MCAAISARRAGADVVVVEHAGRAMRGGNTRHTRNLRIMHDAPTETLAASYPEEEYWQDLRRVTEGHTDEPLARLMIRLSADLLVWLHDVGVRFQPALSGTLSLERTNAFFLGGGKALLNAQYRTAENLGVRIYYECEVIDLAIVNGRFEQATVLASEQQREISAKAVVIASGGFQANTAWMRQIWGDAADNFIIRGSPYNTGTVLKTLMDNEARTVSEPTQFHAVAIDARAPKFDGGIVTRLDCVCFSVVVNKDGERFYDEGEDVWPKRYAIWGGLVAQQPQQIAYAVIDSKVIDEFMPSVFPPMSAASIAELAVKIKIDAATLESTIGTFNQSVVAGDYDPDKLDSCRTQNLAPPKSHWALPIDTPPYYAYPLRPGITFTYLGVEVNNEARVMFADGNPSANVFAAGEVMAGNILGKGYCAGTGMTIGAVFGRIAGEQAACSQ